jgi:hypothetical protein
VAGFQFLLDRVKANVAGQNAPQDVHLVWNTIAFPSPDPVVREIDFTVDAPDTEGTLDDLALSFNFVARFGAGRPVSGSISSGLTYFRFDLEAEPYSAIAGFLGGHAVLFNETYRMSYATDTTDAFGFNVGGSVDFALGSHAAIFVDGRLLWAPETDAPVTLTELLSQSVPTVPISQIDEYLAPAPIAIDPGYFRILLGVKIRP